MNSVHGNKVGAKHRYVGSIGVKISYSSTHKIVEEAIEKGIRSYSKISVIIFMPTLLWRRKELKSKKSCLISSYNTSRIKTK
jgi:hypothetical protein